MIRRWIPAVIFWALFAISIGLYRRYPWLDTVWYAVCMLFLFFLSSFAVVQMFRHRHETTTISYRGIPRWLERFSLDENDDKPKTQSERDSR